MSSMLEQLRELGVNTEEALTRFMNNEALYIRMLKKYPAAAAGVDPAGKFAAKDYDGALTDTHTLKGVTGNLSLTPLYKAYSDIVALIREGKGDQAAKAYEEMLPAEKAIIDCINNS